MRRWSLGFAVCVALVCGGAAAHAEDSWVGKRVELKDNNVKMGHTTPSGEEVVDGDVIESVVTVEKENGKWIRVSSYGVSGWISKDEVVPIDEAVAYFTARMRENPDDSFYVAKRADAWLEKGDLDIALKDQNEALRMSPDDAVLWYNRGVTWDRMKEYEKAIKDYTECFRLDTTYHYALDNRGIDWRKLKEYDKALRDFESAIRLHPNYASYVNDRGTIYHDKGELDKAIRDYSEAMRLDPDEPLYHDNRGLARRDKGDYDGAIKDHADAMRLDPQNAAYVYNRGVAWERKKDYDKAFTDYNAAVKLDPKYADGYSAQAWLLATSPDDAARDGKKAIESAKRACELTQYKVWGCLDNLAAAYAEAGQYDEAVKAQRKALDFTEIGDQDKKDMQERLKLYEDHKPYRMPK